MGKQKATLDSKGRLQGVEFYTNDDDLVFDYTTYKDNLLHGLRFSYNKPRLDLEFFGFFKDDEEIGFWKCKLQYV